MGAASDPKILMKHGIKSVLTVCKQSRIRYNKDFIRHHLILEVLDHPDFEMKYHFQVGVDFISKHLKTGNVFVHCMSGISRSASIIIAYLIMSKNLTYLKAHQFVKNKRGIISPNPGFVM